MSDQMKNTCAACCVRLSLGEVETSLSKLRVQTYSTIRDLSNAGLRETEVFHQLCVTGEALDQLLGDLLVLPIPVDSFNSAVARALRQIETSGENNGSH